MTERPALPVLGAGRSRVPRLPGEKAFPSGRRRGRELLTFAADAVDWGRHPLLRPLARFSSSPYRMCEHRSEDKHEKRLINLRWY